MTNRPKATLKNVRSAQSLTTNELEIKITDETEELKIDKFQETPAVSLVESVLLASHTTDLSKTQS